MAIDREKVAQRLIGIGMALAVVGAVLLLLAVLSGCGPVGPTDPCSQGCTVPVPSSKPLADPDGQEVPYCGPDVVTPCVYIEDTPDGTNHLYYVEASATEAGGFKIRDMGTWN